MATSDPDEMPKLKMYASVPVGVQVPACWCGDRCQLKQSMEYSYTYGRRFFMCANYAHDPVPKRNAYHRPPSPPPICAYFQWLDTEQSAQDEETVRREMALRRERTMDLLRNEEAAENVKRWQEEQRKQDEEKERHAKEAREAERDRKREMARRAQEEVEAGKRKGKYPRWTQ